MRIRRKSKEKENRNGNISNTSKFDDEGGKDERLVALLCRSEDDMLQFVAKANKVYQDLLKRPAPFMTFVFCGMQ